MASIHASKFANLILLHMNGGTQQTKYDSVENIATAVLAKGDGTSTGKMTTTVLTVAKQILKRLKARGLAERIGGKYKISVKAMAEGWNREDPLDLYRPRSEDTGDDMEMEDGDGRDGKEDLDEDEVESAPAPGAHPVEAKEIIELRARVKTLEADCRDLHRELGESDNRLDQVEKLAASAAAVKTIRIEKWDGGKPIILKNVMLPSYFQTMLDLAKMRRNILLVGPAGSGKTTVAGLLAKTMGMKFGKIGGCGGLTESHLLGRYNPLEKGAAKYVASEFVIRFEQGGVMLIDELDGADQNVLLVLNPALDRSGELPLMNQPGKPLAMKHKDFVCIATANTYGTGSNRMYAGRNQLDASTLSRFQIGMIEVGYDHNVERMIFHKFGITELDLLERIWEIRRKANESVLRRVIDTRFVEDAAVMKTGADWSDDQIVSRLVEGWSRDERSKVGAPMAV